MRIISQGGNADLPYEEIALCMASEDIIARHNDKEYLMARYSTMDKAQKAMEMLREYKETKEIRSIPLTKSLMESFSNVKMENFEIYTDGAGDYLKVDIVKKVEYFQFPQDEDMEV